jgi:hypothetical protein
MTDRRFRGVSRHDPLEGHGRRAEGATTTTRASTGIRGTLDEEFTLHEGETDPFRAPRDILEEAAVNVFREYSIGLGTPAEIVRQGRANDGYALVVREEKGRRVLTIPASQEADFTYHGNTGSSGESLAEFLAGTLDNVRADVIRLPLLTRTEAVYLVGLLSRRRPSWHWGTCMTAVRPTLDRNLGGWRRRNSLLRAFEKAQQRDVTFDFPSNVPTNEALELHTRIWGPNRSGAFFGMLDELLRIGAAELLTVRDLEDRLIALGCDIVGERTRHLYYGVSDHESFPGIGTVTMGWSWERFMESSTQTAFSFGRGSERYKYQYVNHDVELFELRGFPACA